MKIKVGRRRVKIRTLIPAFVRFRGLLRRLVRKFSFPTLRNSFLGFRWPLRPRTRDPAALNDRRSRKLVPKGCVAVYVGEERQRFVIPILYLRHQFITRLLAEAEVEFGYKYRGPVTVPCDIHDFEQVKWAIDREITAFQKNFDATFHKR